MKKKNGKVSIVIILVIMLFAILSFFSVPALYNLKDSIEMNKYDKQMANLINSAKSKYSADINNITNDGVVEYKVDELINEGYFHGSEINPLTGKKYNKDDKILVITKNGYSTYKYISGKSLLEEIRENMIKIGDEYYYTGENPNNYISFNEDIYRIIKIDKNNNIKITKMDSNKKVKYNNINSYLNIYYNDEFKEDYKKVISEELSIIDVYTYEKTFNSSKSYLMNNDDFWIKSDDEYKKFDYIKGGVSDTASGLAYVYPIISLDFSVVLEKGNGSRVEPYIFSY